MALSTCTAKHALLFTIILVSMNGINSQHGLVKAVQNINVLLENITDASTVTSMFLANTLNRSADTQSSMDGSLDQMANTQTQMADTQSEIASTQSRMEGTLDQMANTLTQMVQLLQMQSQQLQNVTDTMSLMVEQMNTQNNLISHLPKDIPRDCSEIASRGPYSSGSYTIQSWDNLGIIPVYCDMDTDNGGWTVFQKRFDGSVDFYLGWDDYEDGFGSPDGEYWLGLRQIYQLTQQGSWMLRIDLTDFQDNTAFAEFESFSIGNSASNYQLYVGAYSGNAGNSLAYHNNQPFSTKDNDHDSSSSTHCAEARRGAWWYNACLHSNLNGLYLGESHHSTTGMVWKHWKNSYEVLKRSEMKMRRIR